MTEAGEKGDRPAISVLVISYNTRDLTLEAIRSLLEQTSVPIEVLVVDNASEDGSAEAIKAAFPDIHLIEPAQNLGFAGANNLAAESAKGDYILLLNPDTVVLDKAVDKIYAFAEENPKALIWGGKTLFGDRSLNPSSCWSRQSVWSLISQALGLSSVFRNSSFFNPEGIGGWQRDSVRSVDIVSGCFLLIKKTLWTDLEGFCKAYFMYGEDADLCLRASRFGAKPLISPEPTIIHYGGASEKVRHDQLVRLISAKQLLISHHFPKWQRPIGHCLLALWPFSRMAAHKLLRSSGEKVNVWSTVWRKRADWYPKP